MTTDETYAAVIAFLDQFISRGAAPDVLKLRERLTNDPDTRRLLDEHGLTYAGSSACPTFAVFAGLVLAAARHVVITLANGSTVAAPTLRSPQGLAQSLRFWAANLPCGADIVAIVARDRNGKIVGRADSRFLPHIAG